jgi:hypothetical protein
MFYKTPDCKLPWYDFYVVSLTEFPCLSEMYCHSQCSRESASLCKIKDCLGYNTNHIWRSDSGDCEEKVILTCKAVKFGESPMFRKKYRLNLLLLVSYSSYSSSLKTGAVHSSETSRFLQNTGLITQNPVLLINFAYRYRVQWRQSEIHMLLHAFCSSPRNKELKQWRTPFANTYPKYSSMLKTRSWHARYIIL